MRNELNNKYSKMLAQYEVCYSEWANAGYPTRVIYDGRLQEDADKFFEDWDKVLANLAKAADRETFSNIPAQIREAV
jgi:hypothetical protein